MNYYPIYIYNSFEGHVVGSLQSNNSHYFLYFYLKINSILLFTSSIFTIKIQILKIHNFIMSSQNEMLYFLNYIEFSS